MFLSEGGRGFGHLVASTQRIERDPALGGGSLWASLGCQEFLDSEQASGSTATMCVVEAPSTAGGKHRLLVINAGDSRVLLGRRDGSIVDGKGTDQGPGFDIHFVTGD